MKDERKVYCVRRRKNALLITFGVEIVWDNQLIKRINASWDTYLASPADFAGADDIITNLAKEREPGIEIIERTPLSLIVTSLVIL